MKYYENKRIIIIGATSGIGRELALKYLASNNTVGITGRRTERLEAIKALYPERTFCKTFDVSSEDSPSALGELIAEMGGMDLLVFCSGIGAQNRQLEEGIEMDTVHTNVVGFSLMIIYAYNYFKTRECGHIADISSVAGVKPLRQSPAYSATKRYQTHYMACLAQKARKEKAPIRFTTILPGFIDTDLLKENSYPMTTSLANGSRQIHAAIEKRRRYAIVPRRWRLIVACMKLVPGPLWERIW